MRNYDFTPLRGSMLGFDHLFDLVNNIQHVDLKARTPTTSTGAFRRGHSNAGSALRTMSRSRALRQGCCGRTEATFRRMPFCAGKLFDKQVAVLASERLHSDPSGP